ncbi:hypothetical protein J7L49_02115 [Candidatus Bathyarchaeota archaeon]|nr:hypothetical protein [Candidatus Bathyarchaeota archaeon]
MSFEIQELPDIVRVVVLLSFKEEDRLTKSLLKKKVEEYLANGASIRMGDLDEALEEMVSEGLLTKQDGNFKLTRRGVRLSKEWKNLLIKRDPVLEVVAGLTDGSITGLIVILSAFLAGLHMDMALFTAILSLAAVSITNFSSFMLGGKTEDMANILTLKALIDHSLSDIPDKKERMRSLRLAKHLFTILRREITRSNLLSASLCGLTTFLAGIIPIIAFLGLPKPLNIIVSLGIIGVMTTVFLVRYRAKKAQVSWKVILPETVVIIAVATIISLIIGSGL